MAYPINIRISQKYAYLYIKYNKMANIQKYIPFLFKWEGTKFVDDPNDRGGATRY